ncbi:MAG TPA: hypothetical protein VGV92_06310 [Gammaproteobacteria bacterium]|nr:hypothetical protein [Gammaproteobacteria bacterium]
MSFEVLPKPVLAIIMGFFPPPQRGSLNQVSRICRAVSRFRDDVFKQKYQSDFPLDYARLERINHYSNGLAVPSWEQQFIERHQEVTGNLTQSKKELRDIFKEKNLSRLQKSIEEKRISIDDLDFFSARWPSSESAFADRTLPFKMPYFRVDGAQFSTMYAFQAGLDEIYRSIVTVMPNKKEDAFDLFGLAMVCAQPIEKIKSFYSDKISDQILISEFDYVLMTACALGRTDVVNFLMGKKTSDTNAQGHMLYESACKNTSNATLLGYAKVICAFINEKKIEWRQDFLTYLCSVGASEAVQYLCENMRNLDVNKPDRNGRVPLVESSLIGDVVTLEVLCRAKAKVDVRVLISADREDLICFVGREVTPLIVVCACGYFASIRLLIERGANVNQSVDIFSSPLGLIGRAYTAKYLIEKGAEIDEKTILAFWCQWTPKKDTYLLPLVQLLLDKGCDPNALLESDDEPPQTLLNLVCKNGQSRVARLLIEYGADPTVLTPDQIREHELDGAAHTKKPARCSIQ